MYTPFLQKDILAGDFKFVGHTLVLDVNDEKFDRESSTRAENRSIELLENAIIQRFAVNLENVTEITTSGIGALLSIYMKCQHTNTEFVLYNLNKHIKELLEAIGITNIVNIETVKNTQ